MSKSNIKIQSKLRLLVQSLDKAEKRNFKIFAQRHQSKNLQFVKLFDCIANHQEDKIYSYITIRSRDTLHNLQRHLYQEILKSLRLIQSKHLDDLRIREHIDYARILYHKGFYKDALKLLNKAYSLAEKSNIYILKLEILEFEKLIESKHITRTRTTSTRIESSIQRSKEIVGLVTLKSDLLNVSLQAHGYYIRSGFCKNESEKNQAEAFFKNITQGIRQSSEFYNSVYWNMSHLWLHYCTLSFEECHHYTRGWIRIFEDHPHMKNIEPDLYLRGLHYAMLTSRILDKKEELSKYYLTFDAFTKVKSSSFGAITRSFELIYGIPARLDYIQRTNDPAPDIDSMIAPLHSSRSLKTLDPQRRVSLFYKVALFFFMQKDYHNTLIWIDRLYSDLQKVLRKEMTIYVRLLQALTNFMISRLDMASLLFSKLITQIEEEDPSNKMTLDIAKYLVNIATQKLTLEESHMSAMSSIVEKRKRDRFAIRVQLYFDFEKWLQSLG